jgi:hypothetical protein
MRRKRTPSFDWRAALLRADTILSEPPRKAHVKRPTDLLDHVVFRAALPSELCMTANRLATGTMQKCPWRIGEIKDDLWGKLDPQALHWLRYRRHWPFVPVGGVRPQVLAIKFSGRAPDVGSNPAKAAIDMLQKATSIGQKHRMGIILSDSPERVEQLHWWEQQPMKYPAFLLIEVRV